jgi:UDP-GlcNAc:undecaprenyl-phosphate GlcNAc-1-phosphate transferase
MSVIGFGVSLIIGLLLVPGVRRLSFGLGRVVTPREDRWHRKPTPTLGGLAIFFAFLAGLIATAWINNTWDLIHWDLLAASGTIFLLGLIDDFKQISPPAKLIGQILAAAVVVFLGYTTNFFTPKIPNEFIAQIPNIVLTFIWLVGLTNAINLIDNMDGLAGGISLITTGFLGYFFWRGGDSSLLPIAMALAGSLLGFLIYNLPPASIFMGDSGSLFLGFTLAVLAIARQPQASNVFAVMGVPTLLFMLPILDTTLVTITRLLRGQSPTQGGRDHTSHRLVAFGLSERQTLFVLYGIALISGGLAIGVETLDYWLSLALVPFLVLSLALLTAYLGRLKVVVASTSPRAGAISRIMSELTYKRRTFEITLDFLIVGFALYLAFWAGFGLSLNETRLQLYLRSLPIAIVGSYLSVFLFGVYRGVWRYVGVAELVRYAEATVGAVLLTAMGVFILDSSGRIPILIWILFAIFLFLGLAASRSSFKVLDQLYSHQPKPHEERVLILGAGDTGEMALRWILMNPQFRYRPVGFLDEDPFNIGREIHGVSILGGLDQLQTILDQKQIDGVVLATDERSSIELIDKVVETCQAQKRWVRSLKLEFELLE